MNGKRVLNVMAVLSIGFGLVVSVLATTSPSMLVPFAAVGGAILILLWILVGLNYLLFGRKHAKGSR